MSIERIQDTSIWKRTLAEQQDDKYSEQRKKLREAFLLFRENVSLILSSISQDLPDLTVHDITHSDALWETADLIVGDNYPLTPLESFILGGTFLLHDAALCFEAYENGLKGIRETKEWKDINEYLKLNITQIVDLEQQTDLITIRKLHAKQATELLNKTWNKDNKTIYLLEYSELRKHLGNLIGEIASSHHWDIETVMSKFSPQQNVLPCFPPKWYINPIKIACILRCADIAHIDNERAPDFLFELLKINGISFNHWNAQNRLGKVDIDQDDINKETLLYTSTFGFNENDSEAWFVAYDAICLVDKEIKSCNGILKEKSFKVKKVKGIESPEELSKHIKANGWKPSSLSVHVQDVENVIKTLGGKMLYGQDAKHHLEIVLRELIQNARDAIKAREVFDPKNIGKIVIYIDTDKENTWLTVEDNGIGMSERVLKDSLLNFGSSFWTSNLVLNEHPGLLSSDFKSVGQFGIGFYSVFMIAEQVFVTSKNYKEGINNLKQLKFLKGFSLRPILVEGEQKDFSLSISTKIKIKLKQEYIQKIFNINIFSVIQKSDFKVPFHKYISALCAGLTVDVFYKENDKDEIKIHTDISSKDFDKEQWLTDISFANYNPDTTLKNSIKKNAKRLSPIIDNGQITAMAAINTDYNEIFGSFLKINTIGGLASGIDNRMCRDIIGCMDYKANSAKRDPGWQAHSAESIQIWANEQLQKLLKSNLSPYEKYIASSTLSLYGVDYTELLQIPIFFKGVHKFISIEELIELSRIYPIGFLYQRDLLDIDRINSKSFTYEIDISNILLIQNKNIYISFFFSLDLIDNVPKYKDSLLGCLYRNLQKSGLKIILERQENIGEYKEYIGNDVLTQKIGLLLLRQ